MTAWKWSFRRARGGECYPQYAQKRQGVNVLLVLHRATRRRLAMLLRLRIVWRGAATASRKRRESYRRLLSARNKPECTSHRGGVGIPAVDPANQPSEL